MTLRSMWVLTGSNSRHNRVAYFGRSNTWQQGEEEGRRHHRGEGSVDEEELGGGHCGMSTGGTKNRREKIFAHLHICKCNAATKLHRYRKKHKRHRLTRPVPECSFVNRTGVKKSRP